MDESAAPIATPERDVGMSPLPHEGGSRTKRPRKRKKEKKA